MRLKFISILILLGLHPAHGKLFLDVTVINKKGIDKGLILTSELHSMEEVKRHKPILLKMSGGLRLKLKAHFVQDFRAYGPSSTVAVSGEFQQTGKGESKPLDNSTVVIEAGKMHTFIQKQVDQIVEVTVRPQIL